MEFPTDVEPSSIYGFSFLLSSKQEEIQQVQISYQSSNHLLNSIQTNC